jgi:C-terminal processing protease CtpA/Prc
MDSGAASDDGRLKVGDCVLSVNGVSVDNVTHQQAVDALRNAGSRVTLVLKRKVPVVQAPLSPKLGGTNLEIVLVKGGKGLGFSIAGGIGNQHISGDDGIFVTKIIDGGAASVDGRLSVGDRIISVNSHNLEGVTHDHAVSVLKATKQTVTLVISKTDPFQFNSQQESSSQSSSKAVRFRIYVHYMETQFCYF